MDEATIRTMQSLARRSGAASRARSSTEVSMGELAWLWGAQQAIVGCRGDDNYPIPKKLYRSVGFRELTRELRYVKGQPCPESILT